MTTKSEKLDDESVSSISNLLVKDILILICTVFLWRGFWTIMDDLELQAGMDQMMVWRGVFCVMIGILGLWLLFAIIKMGKGMFL